MNLLFTSAGRRGYLLQWFKDAVGTEGRIHAANSDANAPAFAQADTSVVVPGIHDKEYVPFLLDYCLQHRITAVIPLFDIDIPVLAAARERFAANGVTVVVADEWVANICNDKWSTFKFLKENDFDVPVTEHTLLETRKALAEGRLGLPLFVKPRWGMGSIGVYKVETEAELDVLYAKVLRDVERTYLRFESAATPGGSVLVQECIDGVEYGLDVVNDLAGRHVATFVKKKLAMRSGETDSAVTVDEPELFEMGARIAGLLQHRGNLDMDLFRTKDGRVVVLELNARFGGGYPFSHLAGADLPRAIVAWLAGKPIDPAWLTVRYGVEAAKMIVPTRRTW